jgi:hypothetical protein
MSTASDSSFHSCRQRLEFDEGELPSEGEEEPEEEAADDASEGEEEPEEEAADASEGEEESEEEAADVSEGEEESEEEAADASEGEEESEEEAADASEGEEEPEEAVRDTGAAHELLLVHPLKSFYRLQSWSKAKVEEARSRDRTGVISFIRQLSGYPNCYDRANRRFTECECLTLLDECYHESVANVLGKFFFVAFCVMLLSRVF